jgi:hypothetical protein
VNSRIAVGLGERERKGRTDGFWRSEARGREQRKSQKGGSPHEAGEFVVGAGSLLAKRRGRRREREEAGEGRNECLRELQCSIPKTKRGCAPGQAA